MAASVEVGSAHITVSVDAAQMDRGINRAVAATNRLSGTVLGMQRTLDRFTGSLTSSLIATAAYAAGVNAVRLALGGSVAAYSQWERGLINVQKTANLTRPEVERLGRGLEFMNTQASISGRALGIATKELTDIATVLGQANITGVDNILSLTEVIATMGQTTDLVGKEAADAFAIIVKGTEASSDDAQRLGNVITALGNQFRGGEAGLLEYNKRLVQATQNTSLLAREQLAISAVAQQIGIQNETFSTAIQRAFSTLQIAATQAARGDIEKLAVIFQDIGTEGASGLQAVGDNLDALIAKLAAGDINSFIALLEALQRAGPGNQNNILTTLFGGITPPVRVQQSLQTAVKQLPELRRALEIVNAEWEHGTALTDEAAQSLEAFDRRMGVVRERIAEQGRAIGSVLAPAVLAVSENYEIAAAGAAAFASSVITGFSRRRVAQAREVAKAQRDQATASVAAAKADLNRTEEGIENSKAVIAANNDEQKSVIATSRADINESNKRIAQSKKFVDRNRNLNRDLSNAKKRLARLDAAIARETDNATKSELRQNRRKLTSYIRYREGRSVLLAQEREAIRENRKTVTEANRRIRSSEAEIAKGQTARVVATERLARQEGTAAKQREKLAAAQNNLNQLTNRGARITRALRGVYGFFGGGLGVVIGAVIGLTALYSALTKESRRLSQRSSDIAESLRQVNTEAQATAAGLTGAGLAVRNAEEELERLRHEYEQTLKAQNEFIEAFTIEGDMFPETDLSTFGRRLSDVKASMDEITGLLQINVVLNKELGATADSAGDVMSKAYERINIELDKIPNRLAQLRQGLTDINRQGLEQVNFEIGIEGLSPVRQNIQRRVREVQTTLEEEVLSAQRQLDAYRTTLAETRFSLQLARRNLNDEGIRAGDVEYEIGQRQVESLENAERQALDAVEAQQAYVFALQTQTTADEEVIAELVARRQRILEINRIANEVPQVEIPNYQQQRRVAERALADSQERINREARNRQQEIEVDTFSIREGTGLQAQFEIENEFADRLNDALTEQARVTENLADEKARLLQLEQMLTSATDRNKESIARQVAESRQNVETIKRQANESKFLTAEIRNQQSAYDAAAQSARSLAESGVVGSLTQLSNEVSKFGDKLEDVTTGALNSLENELVSVFEDGKFNVKSLAQSIAIDLVRALIRTVITARLASAILSTFPGLAPTSTGAPPPIQVGHSGGIAGALPGRRSPKMGLRQGELFAILQRGEEVITADDPRHRRNFWNSNYNYLADWVKTLPKYHSGGIAGSPPSAGAARRGSVSFNLINQTSSDIEAVDDGERFDGEGYIRSVILRDARRNGALTQSLRRSVGR